MGIAIACWHWTADDFWRSTPHEYHAAMAVQIEMNRPRDEDANHGG